MDQCRQLLLKGRDLLFPPGVTCPVCRRVVQGQFLCRPCLELLTGEAFPPALRVKGTGWRWLDGALSIWPHGGVAAELVRLLKDHCLAAAAPYLGQWLAEGLMTAQGQDHPAGRLDPLGEDAAVTWVTMPAGRRRLRGIDHGRLLAEAVSQVAGYPYGQLLLRADTGSHTQRGLSGAERKRNLQGLFQGVEDPPATVVLVDDVLTTGATGEACAQAMKQAGVRRVVLLTVTRA